MKILLEYVKKHFLKGVLKLELVVYSGSRGEVGFITLLFFSDCKPVLIAKVARSKRSLERLHREYKNLKHVSQLLQGSPLEATIEIPLDLVDVNGQWFLFKEYINGIPGTQYLNSFLKKRKTRRFLYLGTDWLINFTKQTQALHLNSPGAKMRTIQKLMSGKVDFPNYARVFIDDSSLFLAPSHGEFIPSNVLIDPEKKRVKAILDFEEFQVDGLAVADLVGLIVSSGVFLFGFDQAAINSMFLRNDWFINLCTNCVKKFCRELSIDIRTFKEVIPLYSDRALEICRRWNMTGELMQCHRRLRTFFLKEKNNIFMI